MKTIKKLSVIVAAVCLMATTISCEKGSLVGISGKGEVVSKTIEIGSMDGIDLSISGNVVITKGEEQEVRIEAQRNIIDNIKTKVRNGVWEIEFDKIVRSHKDVTIYITAPEITQLSVSGSGMISSSSAFSSNDLEINVSGSGYVKLNSETNYLKSHISGSGTIDMSGSTNFHEVHISGSGNFNGFDCESTSVDANISGSGNCSVTVNDKLDANISGSGNIRYIGHPSVNANVSGSGSVICSN